MREKVLVVELSLGHYELFYSYKKFFEPEHDVYFGIESLALAEEQGIPQEQILFLNRGITPNFWRIHRFCKSHKIKKILINTAAGPRIGNLSFFLKLLGYELYGTLHNAHKLHGSRSQNYLTKKLHGYFVLNQEICRYWREHSDIKVPIEYIYTCYFPERQIQSPPTNKGLRVAVIGQIETKRRDLNALIDVAKKLQIQRQTNIMFRMIGNSNTPEGERYRNRVKENNVESYFEFFMRRFDYREMLKEVESCHVVALMFHPNTEYSQYYRNSKISGALNFALGLKRPLLVHEFLAGDEYNGIGLYYNENSFADLLIKIRDNPAELSKIQESFSHDPRFQLANQKQRVFQLMNLKKTLKS